MGSSPCRHETTSEPILNQYYLFCTEPIPNESWTNLIGCFDQTVDCKSVHLHLDWFRSGSAFVHISTYPSVHISFQLNRTWIENAFRGFHILTYPWHFPFLSSWKPNRCTCIFISLKSELNIIAWLRNDWRKGMINSIMSDKKLNACNKNASFHLIE